jgi:hypothetical protein
MIPNDQLTEENKVALETLRVDTDKLIESCFRLEKFCTENNLSHLRPDFYSARCKIADAHHTVLVQMGWRK